MAYDKTSVPIARSQEDIKRLLVKHGGFGVAFVSEYDPEGKLGPIEGFHAKVMIEKKPYTIRVTVQLKRSDEQQERRAWRVLFYHMKAIFEAADSGLLEFRQLIMPFIVRPSDGKTIAEVILPQLDSAATSAKLLGGRE